MAENLLRQKLKPPPECPHDEAHAQDLGSMLCKSVAVAGLERLDVALEAQISSLKRVDPETFVEGLWHPALNLVVAIDPEISGLVCLDMPLVNTINDLLTGDIDDPIPEPLNLRNPTPTDAALCRGFVNQTLQALTEMLAEQSGTEKPAFSVDRIAPTPSPHEFADTSYRRAWLDLDIDDGARKGRLCIILPADQLAISHERAADHQIDPVWQKQLTSAVNESRASLNAILHRQKMPIGHIMRLKTGDMLEIPAAAINGIALETGSGTHVVRHLTAQLGEYQEMRAAKVIAFDQADAPPDPPKLIE